MREKLDLLMDSNLQEKLIGTSKEINMTQYVPSEDKRLVKGKTRTYHPCLLIRQVSSDENTRRKPSNKGNIEEILCCFCGRNIVSTRENEQ